MGLIFADGFDHYTAANVSGKWTVGSTGTTATNSRFGVGRALQCTGSNGPKKMFGQNFSEIYMGFAWRPSLAWGRSGNFLMFYDGPDPQFGLFTSGDTYQITATRGATAIGDWLANKVFQANQWYWMELYVKFGNAPDGIIRLWCEGQLILEKTGVDTTATANNSINGFVLGDSNYYSSILWDDVWLINPLDGIAPTASIGNVRFITRFPAANSSVQFTPNANSNYQQVSEANPDGDTSYNASSTVGHKDLFTIASLGVTADVKGVVTTVIAKKDNTGTRALKTVIHAQSGSEQVRSADFYLSSGYEAVQDFSGLIPGTTDPWTVSAVENATFGYTVSL